MKLYDLHPSPDLHPELAILVASLLDSTKEWQENLEQPTQEAMIWQPYPNGPSIGGALLHLASCETYWLDEFIHNKPADLTDPAVSYDRSMDQYVPFWPVPPNEHYEWYRNQLEIHRRRALECIAAHNQPHTVHSRKDYDVTYRWIITHVIEHDSYTGGQAVLLHEMYKQIQRP
jgi:uncharacterized damage-inducible protein DinB